MVWHGTVPIQCGSQWELKALELRIQQMDLHGTALTHLYFYPESAWLGAVHFGSQWVQTSPEAQLHVQQMELIGPVFPQSLAILDGVWHGTLVFNRSF